MTSHSEKVVSRMGEINAFKSPAAANLYLAQGIREIARLRGLIARICEAHEEGGDVALAIDEAGRQAVREAGDEPQASKQKVLTLHGFEIMSLVKFLGGEPDTDVSIAHFEAAKDVETGEDMPAGHYAWCTEYAEEGRVHLSTEPPASSQSADDRYVIELTPAEIRSNHNRVQWAEGLIRQLPATHEGRNSWLLNYSGSEFETLHREALGKGWRTPLPRGDVFQAQSWISYWRACQAHERDPSVGRPVAPHRSGGGAS